MNFNWKKIVPDALCVVLFAVIAFLYFAPEVLEGKRLDGHDHSANDGIAVEINKYREAHDGETPRWVTSVFGGMPTYQIAPSYDSTNGMSIAEKIYHLGFPDYIWYVFASMLGFYILLRAFDFRHWMAALGAVVWAFSSYFFIIIAAGHIWKVITLTYIPPTIAGLVLCYRSMNEEDKKRRGLKLGLGFILTAFFGALQILSNHVQMTYYFLFPIAFMVIAYLVMAVQKKTIGRWVIATAVLACSAVIAVCMNLSNLYNTYEYQKETMRGKSELVKQGDEKNQTDSGLERDYITAWSYGIDETFTFLIPNFRGGASSRGDEYMSMTKNSTAMAKADSEINSYGLYNQFPQYWGDQPGTSGPVYLGAIVCMLFILSLMMIPNKHPMKWALLAATILTLLLSWGRNFMPFTDFFIDHFPMYAKFRTVASILVVVEFTIPLMAMWGLKLFVEKPNMKALYLSVGFTIVLCLVLMFIGGDCISFNERETLNRAISEGQLPTDIAHRLMSSLSDMRHAMLVADGWRSILFIVLGSAVLYWYGNAAKKFDGQLAPSQATILSIALLALCLIDMWQVNKRYLNGDMFKSPDIVAESNLKGQCEQYIINKSGDKRDYRVLNNTVSTFNDNTTSASFNSVGGYHAAKLRRYQELIEAYIGIEKERINGNLTSCPIDTAASMAAQMAIFDMPKQLSDSICPVLNMLNTKWVIAGGQTQDENGNARTVKYPVENKSAMGNAWFVKNIKFVENANEELDNLAKVDLHNTAVVAKKDFSFLKGQGDGTVELTSYISDEAKYTVDSKQGGCVVFSEVYYPGWTATIDGQETEIGRANYILRAINVPAGKHEVVFTFHPKTVKTTESIAIGALCTLLASVVVFLFFAFKKGKKEEK